ncbi:MAG: PKD domain-containing protein [Saprospiraceae bacterium]
MIYNPFSNAMKGCFICAIAVAALLAGCKKDDPPVNGGSLTAAFAHNLQPNCPVPCQICFTNTSQNATSYLWDFGNGQTSTETAPCVTYTSRGTYTVTLTALRGTESVVTTQTLTIQDNLQRYKRTFAANVSGNITHLLSHNGYTYVMMIVDGINKMVRFNSTGESYANFPGTISVNDMVADPDGSILCVGYSGSPSIVGLAKLTSAMTLNFERSHNIGTPAYGYSVVPRNTNNDPGYIIGGRLDNGSYNQARLVNTYLDGLHYGDPVENTHRIGKIFRNAGTGSNSYVTIGEWLDPLQQRTDIHISTANENGVDYLPIHSYLGLGNFYNDVVADAVQYGNSASYAGVGILGDKPTFFAFQYQNQTFSQPLVVQGFTTTGALTLYGVCALANGEGFGVCGTEFSGGVYSIFVAKLNSTGNILWQKRLSTGGLALGNDILATPDGGFLVGGAEACASLTCYYPVLYKLDGNGDFQ